jgi:phosphoglycerate dehydrogenase-like enzyme
VGIAWHILPEMIDPIDPTLLDGLDAVLAFGHLRFDRSIVDKLPRLKLIARFGAGYDGIDLAGLAEAGVVVTNTPIAVRKPMAMATLAMILALAHRLLDNHRAVVAGSWADARGMNRGIGVQGRIVGIVGFGGIGAELSTLARALGFTVAVTDHPSSRRLALDHGVQGLPLLELAAVSDFLVVTAPLTAETRHMIGAEVFAAMKPTAYLVNTSRGPLVDQGALQSALANGSIAGAGLDVLEVEPPAPDDPLLAMDSVLLSAHCLAWTADFTEAVSTSVLESIIDTAEGRRPQHTLNPTVYETGWRREKGES